MSKCAGLRRVHIEREHERSCKARETWSDTARVADAVLGSVELHAEAENTVSIFPWILSDVSRV